MLLDVIQVILAIILIIVVLLQNQGAGLGATFGGEGNIYRTKRGPEKLPIVTMITGSWPAITVVLACLFVGAKLQPHQWLGVLAVAGGLTLVNWTK